MREWEEREHIAFKNRHRSSPIRVALIRAFWMGGHGKCDCGKCKCEEGWYGDACQYPTICNFTRRKSNEMCKNSQDIICSNAGTCHCGRCKCDNLKGNGLIHGKYCECDDRECIDEETGLMCTGHGMCYCGNCYCEAGWHGDKCELQCDIAPWEIKKKCTSPNGKICSNRGTCVCGECICHDVDPTGDWGDIHGDTCECDERNCKAAYDRYSDDFCSESLRKCQGDAHLPCSGRGRLLGFSRMIIMYMLGKTKLLPQMNLCESNLVSPSMYISLQSNICFRLEQFPSTAGCLLNVIRKTNEVEQ
ncbi:hypothetical protein E2320_004813 [Naja naja]|nr:hypothetical protein E2320_004813 [Naja naja]